VTVSPFACSKTHLQNFFLQPALVVGIAILAAVDEVYYLVEPFRPATNKLYYKLRCHKTLSEVNQFLNRVFDQLMTDAR
jgi:hypothetical protein